MTLQFQPSFCATAIRNVVVQVVNQRLLKLQSKGNVTHLRAEVQIKRRKPSKREGHAEEWQTVKGRGHLDEVQALSNGKDILVLIEGAVLGGGAFSRVSVVKGKPPALES